MPRLQLVPVPGRWSIVPPFPGPLFDSAKIYTGLGVGLRSAFLLGICWPPPRRVSCRCPGPSRTCRRWKSPPGPVASCGTAAPDRSRTSGENCAGANLPPCLPLAPGGDDPGGPSDFPGLFFSGSSSHLLGALLGVIRLPVGAFLLSPLLACLSFPWVCFRLLSMSWASACVVSALGGSPVYAARKWAPAAASDLCGLWAL